MSATLAQSLTARTQPEILTQLLADLVTAGVDATGFDSFTVERALPELDAQAQAVSEDLRVSVVQAGFLYLAAQLPDPAWLRRLAKGWYQIDWIPGTKAIQRCRLTNNAAGGPYDLRQRDLLATTPTGVQFRSLESGTLVAGNGHTLDLEFACETIGTAGNVSTGQINKLVTSLPGVTIANFTGSLIVAGTPDESNALLVQRCESKWGTLGAGGHASAYRYLISQVAPTVTRVFVRDDNPFGAGTVGVYLADSAGPATAEEVSAAATYLAPRKPLGSGPVSVLAAPAHNVQVTGTIYTDGSNGSAAADADVALQALASGFTSTTLYLERIRATLMGVRGAVNVTLSLPASDVTLSGAEVLTITSTITIV